jgi:AcrR family transcriptional regulator
MREEILKASLALFKKKGYLGTSMTDIADAVGLTKGGIYHHVEKKGDLLRELHDEMIAAVFDRMKQAVEPEPDPVGKLANWVRVHISIMHDYLDHIAVFFTEVERLDSKTLKRMVYRRDKALKILADIIREGIDAGAFQEGIDPHVASLLVMGTVNWFYQWYNPKGRIPLEEITDMTVRIVCHGVCKAPPRDTR